jgi:hypothetical protein
MRQPRQVDLLHHLLEARADVADQVGDGAFQQDLAARHRAGAELVLQANDPIGVAAAVFQAARQREQCKPRGAAGRAFGARQQQRDVGVGVRAEPFIAMEPPFAVLAARHRLDGADVGAAGALGHELGALPHRGDVAGQHLWQQVVLKLLAGEFADQMDRGVGHADRAHQAEFGLHEQILQRVFGDRRQRAIHAEHASAMAHGVKLEIRERDVLHVAIGRMVVDPVLVAAETVARVQNRWMLVGEASQLVEPAAGQHAEAIEVRFQVAEIFRREIKRQQIAQAAIERVEILPRAVGRDIAEAATLILENRNGRASGARVHGEPRFQAARRIPLDRGGFRNKCLVWFNIPFRQIFLLSRPIGLRLAMRPSRVENISA